MKTKSLLIAALALAAAMSCAPVSAQAQDYCREYTRTVYIGGREQAAYGMACYQPNGDWKIVDETDRSRIGQRFRNEDVANRYDQPVYQPVYQGVSRPYYHRPVPQTTRIVFAMGSERPYAHGRPFHRGPDKGHDRGRDRGHERGHERGGHHHR